MRLFKLDLTFQIEGTQRELVARVRPGVDREGGNPVLVPVVNPVPAAEVNNPDPKVSRMADDCTLLVKLDSDNLNRIIVILQEFEEISGLGCNLEKTFLMPVGIYQQKFLNLGYQ